MAHIVEKQEVVSIPRAEYRRLKKLDVRFSDFLAYLGHLFDIREAREEVKKGKVVSQEKLFKRLGL